MKTLLLLLLAHSLLISGCSTITAGGAEITGLSLLNDRRSRDAILADEAIEDNAGAKLNAYYDLRDKCHFNITAYNGAVLVTGETPKEEFRSRIIDIVRVIPNVKLVHNKLIIAQPSPFNFRANDTLITGRVKTALTQIPGFDASWVKVITEKSTVYLMGLVHRNEGAAAIDAARHQSDVNQIITVFEYID
ncbi:BON domain-containing protein [Methylobacter sp.]|uniref:BON domain-containing protein n=1 Tax=Methylobacter sp. TaxID=2051955 RepID=UPI002488F3F1|nr:BON domain-containing protein [Methylobacter sp.]MDI1275896.1 BON domain-containing protein [Methylobacter sp.]MDI1356638.1 BON domain-containing protein [Methylobacter sp.]